MQSSSKSYFQCYVSAPQDDELWEDDPQEYVRKSQDLIEDMYSPRMAACSYIQELVITGRRLKENLPKV